MDQKNIEVVLRTQEEEERELNVPLLKARMGKMKKKLLAIVALALAAGLVLGLLRGVMNGVSTVTAMVSFAYEGVEKGEDPNGAVFDINKMKAPVILEAALSDVGNTTISVEQLRTTLSFAGVVPSDVQARIATLQTIGEKTPAALEQILEIEYYPSQYKVTLDISKLKLSPNEGISLLTAVLEEYRNWFFKTYGGATSLGESIASMDLSTYDYAEAVDIIETNTTLLSTYLNKLRAEDPSFRSAETGFTFSDLLSQITVLTDIDLAKLNSLIISTGLTRDQAALEAYYLYQITMVETELAKIRQQQQGIQASITAYQKDSVVIMGGEAGSQMATMNQPSEAYDDFFRQRTVLDGQAAEQQKRLTTLQQRLASLRTVDGSALPPAQVAEAKIRVEEAIPLLAAKLADLIKVVNTTADEYYETVSLKTAYQISLPAQVFASGIRDVLKQAMMFTAIGGVLGVMVCCGMIFLPPLFTSNLFSKISRKKEESAE